MKKVVRTALGLLALAAGPALGEWRQVVSAANSTAYADPTSIRRGAAAATMRVLIDYRKPPFDGNNLPYLSLTMRNEYSCGDGRFRVLEITSHAGPMGSGERPFTTDEPGAWEIVSPHTVQQDLLKLACGVEPASKPAAGNRKKP